MTCSDPTPCTAGSSNLVTTIYVYDAMGQVAAEYSTQPAMGGTEYYTADHLGSTRMVTDADGNVKRRYDYLPFGEELFAGTNGRSSLYPAAPPNTPAQVGMLFTSKERDAESGLDYFGARYFASPQGRFTSPDGPFSDQYSSDPQSWNLYSYGRNNPLTGTDPTGTTFQICDLGGNCDYNYSDQSFYDNFQNGLGVTLDGNDIYLNGTLIGTWERLSFDDLGMLGNGVYNQMAARRQSSNGFIAGFAVSSVAVGVTGGTISGVGATLPSQGSLGLGGRLAARLLPVGVTLQQFANGIIQWGKDAGGNAVSLARIATLNLKELRSAGVTREIAQSWQQFYSYVAQMNPANPNAKGRAQLFQAIVDLFDKGK